MDILYGSSGSCSLVAAIALATCGRDHELRDLELLPEGAGSDEYAKISPLRRVPVLLTDGGWIHELLNILDYLAELHPEAELIPRGQPARCQAMRWLSFCATEMQPVFRFVVRPERLAGDGDSPRAGVRTQAARLFSEAAAVAARHLSEHRWLAGDTYSMADVYLAALTGWAGLATLPIGRDPRLLGHAKRVNARAEVRLAREKHGVIPHIVRPG